MVSAAVSSERISARPPKAAVSALGLPFLAVPSDKWRIRVNISSVHEQNDLERAVAAFSQTGHDLEVSR